MTCIIHLLLFVRCVTALVLSRVNNSIIYSWYYVWLFGFSFKHIKQYDTTVYVGIWVIEALATKNTTSKDHPKDILHDNNYLYRILLVALASNIVFTTSGVENTFRQLNIYIFNHKNSKFCLPYSLTHSLITVARLETKQSSAQPPFYNTRINSLVGCAFWGSDECASYVPCHSFFLPLGCSSSSRETMLRC